ncbi:hypothetical protein JRI60_08205 [Archangium violaceum]|uniref:hypothetical protein n=1 Tax=Archangium violaceum TaxID=83451 RepID=UPI001950771F|nr:hypothetical protein [Archangium violaceum]QRN98996.1 hypothetical protein JRI60_08205 [Archangium violaceum]
MRRQLEGRVETLEAAHARHALLESLLSGRRWKRRLRARPDVIPGVLRHEAALDEAVTRIQRRAQTDRWPEELPVLTTVRDVRGLQRRLEALVLQRLGELSRVSGTPSFAEALGRLEGLVFRPIPLELAAGEVRLLEGQAMNVWVWRRIQALLILCMLLARFDGHPGSIALLVLFIVYSVHGVSRPDRYWLTTERLVWLPHAGEPVQVPLRSISGDGIQLRLGGVHVEGERKVLIQDPKQFRLLAVLLEMRRQPPLLGVASAEPLADVVCYEATLEGSYSQGGYVVLRPGYAAFLPKDRGMDVLRAILGTRPSFFVRPHDIPLIIEQLRYLPSEAAFDACVERAVAASGGVRWSAWEARYDSHAPVWKIRILSAERPPRSLSGKVGWSQQATVRRLLADWPNR